MYIQKTTLCKEPQSILKITKKREKSKNKEKKLIKKKKRTKKQRERCTRCESASPRPIKKGTNKKGKQLVIGSKFSKSAGCVPSKYTTSNSMKLNSKC